MKILVDNGLIRITASDGTEHKLEITGDAQALAKRVHDLTGAIAGLKFIVKAVKGRYQFSEEEAGALGDSAERALAALEAEAKLFLNLYTKRT